MLNRHKFASWWRCSKKAASRTYTSALPTLVIGFSIGLLLAAGFGTYHDNLMPFAQMVNQTSDVNIRVNMQQQVTALKSELISSWEQQAKARNLIVSLPGQFQAKIFKEVKLNRQEKVVALTFDDGPWPRSTEQILSILKQHQIKGTFFWIGENVQSFPQIAQAVVNDGQVIGNHTWHHWYRRMNEATAKSEIDRTATVIYQTTGVKTNLFRPPGGILNNGTADYAKTQNYGVVMWSSDSEDYSRPPVSRLVKNALRNVKPGGIVLMHDGGGDRSHTVEALPQIIATLAHDGYRFVTVPELLEIKEKEDKSIIKQV